MQVIPEERESVAEDSTIGGYRILEPLGQGGMGLVFRAKFPGDSEVVALKTIAAGNLAAPQDVRRFRQEAEAVSRLEHPHIVPVHVVGEEEGRHYFVMKLAEGGSLADLAPEEGEIGSVMDPRAAAKLVGKVARGVHFAHQRGILHRDLKPGNILLDEKGEPMVADFGLAKLISGGTQLTLAGAALGTPSYMAPEQAGGVPEELTIAADVYSLGAILYFLLTGNPPFNAPSALELLKRIGTELPVAPRRMGVDVDRDLELICLKCLEKNPAGRYGSAGAYADDLERWTYGEPINARPATVFERVRCWARRRPVLAASSLLGAVATITLAAVLSVATVLLQKGRDVALAHEQNARASADQAGLEAQRAEASRARTRLNLYAADMSLTGRAIEEGDFGLARTSLARHDGEEEGEDLRGFEWYAYQSRCVGEELRRMEGHGGPVTGLAFDPSGRRLVSVGRDESIRFWSVATGTEIGKVPASHTPKETAELLLYPALLAESPELFRSWMTPEVSLAEIRMRSRPSRPGEFRSVAWSHDGRRLVTGSLGSYVRIWDAAKQRLKGALPISNARKVGYSQDDSRIIIGVGEWGRQSSEVRIYDAKSLKRVRTVEHTRPVFALSPDGTKLAVARGVRDIEIQDLETGKVLHKWQAPQVVDELVYSPDGRVLAILEMAGRLLRVFDAASGKTLKRIDFSTSRLTALVFSGDGRFLLGAGTDHAVRRFDGHTFEELDSLRGHDNEVLSLASFGSEGLFASGGNDHSVRIWSAKDGKQQSSGIEVAGRGVELSLGGGLLLVQGEEGAICQNLRADQSVTRKGKEALGFNETGSHFASLTKGGKGTGIIEVTATSGEGSSRIGEVRLREDSFLAGAKGSCGLMAVGTQKEGLQLYDFWNARELVPLEESEKLKGSRFEFSQDGTYLACLRWPRKITLWECETGKHLRTWEASEGTVHAIALSPDERFLISGGDDNLVTVWELATGERVTTLRGHKDELKAMKFSPDGETIVSAGRDLTVRLWHVATWRDLGVLERGYSYRWIAFSGDGSALLGAADPRKLRRIVEVKK